jgi:hypothetical protein
MPTIAKPNFQNPFSKQPAAAKPNTVGNQNEIKR